MVHSYNPPHTSACIGRLHIEKTDYGRVKEAWTDRPAVIAEGEGVRFVTTKTTSNSVEPLEFR